MSIHSDRINEDQDDLQKYRLMSKGEPVICKQFGCGRQLTLEERLYGDYCSAHNGTEDWKTRTIKYYMKSSARKLA